MDVKSTTTTMPLANELDPAGPAGPTNAGNTVSGTSDERIVNNTMRHQYRVLSDEEKAHMQDIKDIGAAFIAKLDSLVLNHGNSPMELSIARVKAIEATMWAVRHITA